MWKYQVTIHWAGKEKLLRHCVPQCILLIIYFLLLQELCQSIYDKNKGSVIDTNEEDTPDEEEYKEEDMQVQTRTMPGFQTVHVLVFMALVKEFCTLWWQSVRSSKYNFSLSGI